MPHCNSIQSSHINLRKYTNIKRPCPTISGHAWIHHSPKMNPSLNSILSLGVCVRSEASVLIFVIALIGQ